MTFAIQVRHLINFSSGRRHLSAPFNQQLMPPTQMRQLISNVLGHPSAPFNPLVFRDGLRNITRHNHAQEYKAQVKFYLRTLHAYAQVIE